VKVSIFDLHADLPADIVRRRELGEHQVLERQHHAKLTEGQIAGLIAPIWVESTHKPVGALKRALQIVDALYQDLAESTDFVLARNYEDLSNAGSANRIALVLGAEGGEFIEDDVGILRDFQRLGLRCFGFVWDQRNLLADGWTHKDYDRGLTEFGRQVVEELERLRILIDLAHIAPRSFWDVIEIAKRPLIVSHGATVRHSALRSLTDEQLEAIAKNQGVVGICAVTGGSTMDLDAFCDHVQHAVQVAGIHHVSFGFDFYDYLVEQMMTEVGECNLMAGLENHSKTPGLLSELVRRGFSEKEIRFMACENFLRVFRDVVG